MSITKPTVSNVWASAAAEGDIVTPSGGQQVAGFTPSIAAPPYQWMNWVLKQATSMGRYLMARGIPSYDADETYSGFDVCRWTDNIVYEHLDIGNTIGIAPPQSNTWQPFGATWLPDALKASLATKLPALMIVAIKGLLGIYSQVNGDVTAGTIQFGGIQLCWRKYTFTISNTLPVSGSVTWDNPFGAIFGVLATPVDYHLIVSIPHCSTTGADVVPTVTGSSVWQTASAFILAIGTTPA
jgi:hypothetical protein